jgi:hypothetical protein
MTRTAHGKTRNTPVALYIYQGTKHEDAPWQGPSCGTYAGWNEHQRNGEHHCDRCKRAHADYVREWRLRTGRVKSIRVRLIPAQLAALQRIGQPASADNNYSVKLDGDSIS